MNAEERLEPALRHLAYWSLIITVAVSTLSLIGWALGSTLLTGIKQGYIPIAPSTALCFLIVSVPFLVYIFIPDTLFRTITAFCASFTILIASILLISFVMGIIIEAEHLGFAYLHSQTMLKSGHMSPVTAIMFVAASSGILMLCLPGRRKQLYKNAASFVALGVSITGFIMFLGYLHGTPLLYGLNIIPIALPTSVAFVFLGLGIFLASGASVPVVRIFTGSSMRSRLTRAFLPVAVAFALISNVIDTIALSLTVNMALTSSLTAIVAATIVGFIIAKIAGAIGIEIDQANRERDEKVIALQKSEEKYRNLFNTIQDGFVLVDMQGHIHECNQAYADMLGYTQKEVTKLTYIQLTPEKWHDMEADIVNENIIKTGYSDLYNKEYIRKDGTVFPINIRVWLIKDEQGSPNGMWAIARDITDHKRVEVALHRSEKNFRRSLDDSPLGVRIVTVEGETIYTNQAILDIYGYNSIEELNTTPVENRYTPESYAEFQIRREKRKRGDYGPSEYGISIVRKDGEVRHLQVFRKEVLWDGERQFQVVYQDITERKRAEVALQTSREQMRALAGRLQAVREEERTNIAREIHDELGGALTGLKIDFSLLTRATLKIENETVRASLLAGMDSMTKFIDATIRTVRRIAMELRPGILDDLGLAAALEWQLKDFEKRTGIQCEFFPPEEDISLDADLSTALFRIFQESLTNVARHSGAKEVRVRLRADGDSYTLEVEDNGKGIKKEKTLSKESLGLLGMRERALMFGGRLTVTGTPGTGTTVTVDIPPSSTTPLLAAG